MAFAGANFLSKQELRQNYLKKVLRRAFLGDNANLASEA
jgi:hypothetical protein